MKIFQSPKYGEEYDRIDGLYVFGEEVDQRFGSLWQRSQYQYKEPLKAQGSGLHLLHWYIWHIFVCFQ